MKIFSLLIAISLIALDLSFANPAETIKVAAIFAKTGNAASDNSYSLDGVKFAIQELNKQGGVIGKKLELLEFDNKSSALGSKIAAKKAVESGVVIIFGASWSSHSLAMAPVCQEAKIPMISPYSTNPDVTLVGDYIFRMCFINSFQGKVMAKFAFQNLKAKSAGVLINANSKFSESLAKYFIKNYQSQGGEILFTTTYLEQSADFNDIINKIKIFKPQVIFLPDHENDSGHIIKQVRENKIFTTFISGDGWDNTMYKSVGTVIEGNFFSGHWHRDNNSAENRKFVKNYTKYSNNFDSGNALSYDSVSLFADAVRRAGSLNPTKIRDAIADTKNFKGVTGNISFDKNGDPVKSVIILKFDKGTSVFVKSVEPDES